MADINLGRIGFVPKGAHNPASSYSVLDTVVYAKNGYCCIKPVPVNSGILPTNTEYFQLLVEKGEQGIPGPGGTGPKGDAFTYSDFTTEQLEDITSGIAAFKTIIRGQETKIGTIRLFNLDYDLYRMIVSISNIPTTLNEETTYTLATIPLGFNLYLKTDSLVAAQEAGAATSDFYNDYYKISRLFVDSDLCTKVTIKCIQAVTETVKATIQVEYIKDFGDVLELSVTVPVGINPADVNLTFPRLKYNKKSVVSIEVDDTAPTWNNLFSVINKRWVDNELMSYFIPGDVRNFTYHKDFTYVKNGVTYTKSTGQYPAKFCEYTDGAGVKHRYSFGISCWWWKMGESNDTDDLPTAPGWIERERNRVQSWAFNTTSAAEIRFMQDFGISIDFHDLYQFALAGVKNFNSVTQDEFDTAVKYDSAKFLALIDRVPKTGSQPGGDSVYDRFSECPYISFRYMDVNSGDYIGRNFKPFAEATLLDKKSFMPMRRFIIGDYTLTSFKNTIAAEVAANPADKVWEILGLHTPYRDSGYFEFFSEIESLYGASGDDSLWFPSIDEMFEYWFMTNYGASHKTVEGQTIKFKIHAPCGHNFYFKSLSCLLSGISTLTDVSVTSSGNCNGTSYGLSDNQLLVNLDFNTDLIAKVEKYLAIFEANPAADYAYDDALYFIQQLKVGVKEPYQIRLNAFVSAPTLTAVSINAGAATTSSNSIIVALSVVGSAAQMMLSEDANFAGASWVPFAASSSFVLSSGFTVKTVFVQLRNSFGDSSVLSDGISFIDTPLVLSSMIINAGASITNTDTVSLSLTYVGAPTQMMLSEDANFAGANWVAFSATPSFTLTSGYAVKTIYAKLQNATTVSDAVNDSIEYAFVEAVALTSIVINTGAENTSNNIVSVSLSYTGSPTQYRISESATFVGASWIALSGATVSFTMSAALGVKTVYAQVQNTVGVSSVRNDSITLQLAPAGAVCSFTGSGNNISYPTIGGTTINVFDPGNLDSYYSPLQLKSKAGAALQWFCEKNTSYFQANSETITTDAYFENNGLTLTGDTGVYPDVYLNRLLAINGGQAGPKKGRIIFSLPAGSYKFKLLMSAPEGYAITAQTLPYCFYRIDVGGTVGTPVQVGATGFTGVGNREFNAEIDIVVPSAANGNVVLYVYNDYTSVLGYRPGINLIEISKTA